MGTGDGGRLGVVGREAGGGGHWGWRAFSGAPGRWADERRGGSGVTPDHVRRYETHWGPFGGGALGFSGARWVPLGVPEPTTAITEPKPRVLRRTAAEGQGVPEAGVEPCHVRVWSCTCSADLLPPHLPRCVVLCVANCLLTAAGRQVLPQHAGQGGGRQAGGRATAAAGGQEGRAAGGWEGGGQLMARAHQRGRKAGVKGKGRTAWGAVWAGAWIWP